MGPCSHSGEWRKCRTIIRENTNLLPVGKSLVKVDSGSDRGAPHTSDSDRTTRFRRGQNIDGHVSGSNTKILKYANLHFNTTSIAHYCEKLNLIFNLIHMHKCH